MDEQVHANLGVELRQRMEKSRFHVMQKERAGAKCVLYPPPFSRCMILR